MSPLDILWDEEIEAALLDEVDDIKEPTPPQPDCRTCRYHHELGCHQYMSNMRDTARHCVNGDKYIEAPKVVLWRTEPKQ